jgi:SprT-like protein
MDKKTYHERIEEANRRIDDYVHRVALRDFHRPFLHHAYFMQPGYCGGTQGMMVQGSDCHIELKARSFMDPYFIKTIRHELIHYFLYQDHQPCGHTKAFKEWSVKVDAGGTFSHRGDEFLFLRVYCPSCGKYGRLRYGAPLEKQHCIRCKNRGLLIDDYFNMNTVWCKEADNARKTISENLSYVIIDLDGCFVKERQDLLPRPVKCTTTYRRAYVFKDLKEAQAIANLINGEVLNRYMAGYIQIECPYLFRCKNCKRRERSESPKLKRSIICKKCGANEFILKGIR